MAYKQAYASQCEMFGCTSQIRYSVYNTYNGLIGCYCTRHANKRVRELQEAEASIKPRANKEVLDER